MSCLMLFGMNNTTYVRNELHSTLSLLAPSSKCCTNRAIQQSRKGVAHKNALGAVGLLLKMPSIKYFHHALMLPCQHNNPNLHEHSVDSVFMFQASVWTINCDTQTWGE